MTYHKACVENYSTECNPGDCHNSEKIGWKPEYLRTRMVEEWNRNPEYYKCEKAYYRCQKVWMETEWWWVDGVLWDACQVNVWIKDTIFTWDPLIETLGGDFWVRW